MNRGVNRDEGPYIPTTTRRSLGYYQRRGGVLLLRQRNLELWNGGTQSPRTVGLFELFIWFSCQYCIGFQFSTTHPERRILSFVPMISPCHNFDLKQQPYKILNWSCHLLPSRSYHLPASVPDVSKCSSEKQASFFFLSPVDASTIVVHGKLTHRTLKSKAFFGSLEMISRLYSKHILARSLDSNWKWCTKGESKWPSGSVGLNRRMSTPPGQDASRMWELGWAESPDLNPLYFVPNEFGLEKSKKNFWAYHIRLKYKNSRLV